MYFSSSLSSFAIFQISILHQDFIDIVFCQVMQIMLTKHSNTLVLAFGIEDESISPKRYFLGNMWISWSLVVVEDFSHCPSIVWKFTFSYPIAWWLIISLSFGIYILKNINWVIQNKYWIFSSFSLFKTYFFQYVASI